MKLKEATIRSNTIYEVKSGGFDAWRWEKKRTPKDLRWDLKPQFKVPQNVKRKSINKKKNLQELIDMKRKEKT